MDRAEAITKIKDACKGMAIDLMKITPAIPHLNDKATQDELFQTVYRLTKDIEIIKKRVIKLETSQDTPDL